ncbi:MAG: hypothetical protein KJZ54_10485 [Phycisphaerales bacterium]|nr:hypothetical protein [Phycisphaerales bacterium]
MRPTGPMFESLENRKLLASIVVDTLADNIDLDGKISLREALTAANTDAAFGDAPAGSLIDQIYFDASIAGGTIVLQLGELSITDGLFLFGMTPEVVNANITIDGNNASRIFSINDGDDNTHQNVTITDLTLTRGAAAHSGGAIQSRETLSLFRSVLADNTAVVSGGAISHQHSSLTITDSRISGNTAGNVDGNHRGGGVQYTSTVGSLTITNTVIRDNTAFSGGGLHSSGTTGVTITGSEISGNSANLAGGIAMFTPGGAKLIQNSTISGNSSAGFGSGIHFDGNDQDPSTVTIANSTFTANVADTNNNAGNPFSNGAIWLSNNANLVLHSTIVAGNTRTPDNPIPSDLHAFFGGTIDADGSMNNLIGDPDSAGGLVNGVNGNLVGVDALLGPLSDHNGLTRTHALLAGSPAIDAGSNTQTLTTDQRGLLFSREFGGAPDIGAFERQKLSLNVDTASMEANNDFSPGNLSLREAVTLANKNPGTDEIGFDASIHGGSLVLGGSDLSFTDPVDIVGPGPDRLTIDGGGASGVFSIPGDAGGGASSISGLTITGGNAAQGGGIFNTGELTLTNTRIDSNTAGQGGGIYNSGTLSLLGTTVSNNTADGEGGGIENDGGTVSITNSTISGNTAGSAGGGVDNFGGLLTVTTSTFSNNTTQGSGGAVWTDTTLTIRNSTISGNSAGDFGGGVGMFGGTVDISNSTIASNRANTNGIDGFGVGGGIDVGGAQGDGVLTIHSTIVADNTFGATSSPTPNDITLTNGGTIAPASANNLVGDAATAGGLVNGENGNLVGASAGLLALADNGGATQTHALDTTSAAINAGSNPDSLTTDQRGKSRVRNGAPDIGAFESGSPTIASLTTSIVAGEWFRGDAVTLTANGVEDEDGTPQSVAFYFDANGNGVPDDDEIIGQDTDAAGGFTIVVPGSVTLGWTSTSRLFAIAVGVFAQSSEAASDEVATPYSVNAAQGAVARSASDAGDRHWVAFRNDRNGVTVFFEGSWNAVDPMEQAGTAAALVSDPVVWFDAGDGTVNVAAATVNGLIVFTRSAAGEWTQVNLSVSFFSPGQGNGAYNAGDSFSKLVQFTSNAGIVVVAGVHDATGRILSFMLSAPVESSRLWSFRDISTELNNQGMGTPALSEMIAYVTAWDAWNLAGIDADGNIQSIWVFPELFSQWRRDNLSAITGAAPIAGQLTVTLTTWQGINLAGVNAAGDLVVTWWVPQFGGNWENNNLTTETDGASKLAAGRVTGYVTPWGGINYAGLRGDGEVVVYWWVPGFTGWLVDALTEDISASQPRPVGTLTSHGSDAGTLSIQGVSENEEVVRLYWKVPPAPDAWTLENLTDEAVRT